MGETAHELRLLHQHRTKSIEPKDANSPLSYSLCVEFNLITLPLQRKFSVFYQRRKSIRPLSPPSVLSFPLSSLSFILSCCASPQLLYIQLIKLLLWLR